MKKKNWNLYCMTLLSITALGLVSLCVQDSAAAEDASGVAIVAHKDVKESELGKKDVEAIFLGKKTKWGDNSKIVFVTLKSGDAHESFLKNLVGKTSSQFTNFWKKQVFTGKGKMPQSFKTEKELLDFIGKTKSAVGYVSAKAANDLNDNVKIITVKNDK